MQLLDRGAAQRSAGIVSENASGEGQPLLSDVYYLERALSPYAEIAKGGVAQLLDKHVSVLLLADVAKISADDIAKVKDFVSHGGVLIRFAGERMTNGSDELVPVPAARRRTLSGQRHGLVRAAASGGFRTAKSFQRIGDRLGSDGDSQILAEPSAELSNRTWAQLSDGTPLITAQAMGSGWIVLFHIAASPGWSSLPLSGLYVEMLKRLLALSAGTPARELAGLTSLPPVSLLDGFGRAMPPPPDVAPLPARDFSRQRVSPQHPPGLYGAHEVESALNVMHADEHLSPLADGGQAYGNTHARALEPYLLAAAMLLLLLDCILSLWLRGFTPRKLRWVGAALAFLLIAPHARADDATNMKAALDTRLAYVRTFRLSDVDTNQPGRPHRPGLCDQAAHLL